MEAGRPLCLEGDSGPVGARQSDFDALAALCAKKKTDANVDGSNVEEVGT